MISKEIRYMLAIRRYGSITKAADSLFITQSALSKAVKNIERQLGSPLFSRIGNDLIPTHIGNRYMDYAEKICQICSDWNSECEDLLGEQCDSYSGSDAWFLPAAGCTQPVLFPLPGRAD